MQMAVALLMQHPELARHVTDPDYFQSVDMAGMPLFSDLVRLLQEKPELKTGYIIENYRDSEYQPHLAKLAAWQHPVMQQDVEAEFLDLVQHLRRKVNGYKTEALLLKHRAGQLDKEGVVQLNRLLQEKQEFDRIRH